MTPKEFQRTFSAMVGSTALPEASFSESRFGLGPEGGARTEEEKGSQVQGPFAVGNRYITGCFERKQNAVTTTCFQARSRERVESAEFEAVCQVGSREFVLTGYNTNPGSVLVSSAHDRAVVDWSANSPRLDLQILFQSHREAPLIFKWLAVTNRGDQPVRILGAMVDSLEITARPEPLRGGVGQPAVLRNDFFLGIKHPAAANDSRDLSIRLSHYLYIEIPPGEKWQSHQAVLGAAVEGETAEKGFTSDLKYSAWRLSSRWLRRVRDDDLLQFL